jgi:hypothetical protein
MEELKHEKVKQVINSIPESELEKESPLLSQVRVSFIDSRKQMGLVEKTISEYGYYLDEMMEIIDDKPIQEITHSDGRTYVDILGQLPVNKEKDPKYRDKTISEILKMKGVKPQNPQNVNKKLGRISTFWKWVGEKYPD